MIVTPQRSLRGTPALRDICVSPATIALEYIVETSLLYCNNPRRKRVTSILFRITLREVLHAALYVKRTYFDSHRKEPNITQPVKVDDCIYAHWAHDHQVQIFFFCHQSNIDNRKLYLESQPQPWCHYHICSFDDSEK